MIQGPLQIFLPRVPIPSPPGSPASGRGQVEEQLRQMDRQVDGQMDRQMDALRAEQLWLPGSSELVGPTANAPHRVQALARDGVARATHLGQLIPLAA